MTPLISIIITTYNWTEALEQVLSSLMLQKDGRFEVIIADDGSKAETRELIEKFADRASFPIKHFWQEDRSFRVARCRNGGVSLATGEYLIFSDGDCCFLPDFISNHRELMEDGQMVTGKRCFLKKRFTNRVLKNKTAFYSWPRAILFILGLFGACNRAFQILPIPQSDAQRKRVPLEWRNAQTCNLAVWTKDFQRVDGFDASYENHGMEDSDFILRIIRSGVTRKTANYTSPVLHLYHRRGDDTGRFDTDGQNYKRLAALEADVERYTPIIGYSECHG
ncbi:MAG: glycosyltransferase [Rhodospirillales bacterium]|jgi:glycosyltransferase involved in cell wall biosynthesis|nr:glycosyltransferase [Rhodospirillales bacterium]MBT4040498.1 glycosyltransferase [Rhodospirillales bacterium]MBT4627899.1 glycosyltransferase [Rhodospirillales bacterium]MBT5351535.1 glycosyltransferase [Rhodospirillales bacterium]MBT5520006.1 glycosyltransferase [Rhodospirillales bacterium]